MSRLSSPAYYLVFAFLTLGLLGCSSTPPTRFFVLNSIAGKRLIGPENEYCPRICVGPVKIPEYLNQPEIVTRVDINEIQMHDFAEWAEPLEESISRTVAGNLSALLCTRAAGVFPCKDGRPFAYQIEIRVIQMDGTLGETASLEVSWSVVDGTDQKRPLRLSKKTNYEEAVQGQGFDALVSAQDGNLASFSCDIAEAVCLIESNRAKAHQFSRRRRGGSVADLE